MNKKLEKTFDLPSMEEVLEGQEQDNTESKINDLGHDTSKYKSGCLLYTSPSPRDRG